MLKAVDFFCGAGGMSYGFMRAGIQILGGIDFNSDCGETYKKNIPNAEFICEDIAVLNFKRITEAFGLKPWDDNLIFIGCSPCQFWSKVKTSKDKVRQGADLIKYFQKFVKYYRPGFIVIENVPGLLTKSEQSLLPKFKLFLKKAGYRYDADVLNARFYGVPQNRFRFLLLASRVAKDLRLPLGCIDDSLTVRKFIGDRSKFPPITAGETCPGIEMHRASHLSAENLWRIKLTDPDGGNRYGWKDDIDLQIPAYKGKDESFRDVYSRMFWDRPAPTITTRFNSFSNGRFGHPEQDRAISLLEGSCLQTFPYDYTFLGRSQKSITRQIGNAVPPAMSERIAQHILKTANG